MQLYLLLCLTISTISAQVYQYDPYGHYSSVQSPDDYYSQQLVDDDDLTQTIHQQPILRLGDDVFSTSSEEDVNETPAINAPTPALTTTPSPQYTIAQLMKDKMLLDTVAKITKAKEDYKKKHSDLILAYQTKLNDLNTKYQLKYAQLQMVNPDETSAAYSLLKLQTQMKTDDLKQKYKLKEADMISKYKLKLNALAQQMALLSPEKQPETPTDDDLDEDDDQPIVPRLKLGAGVPSSSEEVTTKKSKVKKPKTKKEKTDPKTKVLDPATQIELLKEDYKKKHDDLVTSYETKLGDIQTKYQQKIVNLTEVTPEGEENPTLSKLKMDTQKKIDDLKQKYKLKEQDMITKYKSKIDVLVQELESQPKPEATSEVSRDLNQESEEFTQQTHDLAPDYLQNEDLTQTQYPQPPKYPQTGDFTQQTQYIQPPPQYPQTQYVQPAPQYPQTQYIPPQFPYPQTQYVQPAQYPQTPQYIQVPQYPQIQYGQPAQYPQTGDLTQQSQYLQPQYQQNEDFTQQTQNEDILQPYTTYFTKIQQKPLPKLSFQHTLDVVHPSLKLSADSSVPATTDLTSDSTLDATTSPNPATTPAVLPLFWMNFGKMMGKAMAAAKFNMLSQMLTTPAPVNPLVDPASTVASPATPDLNTAFLNEFGKQLQAAIAAKAYLKSLKTTTPLPPNTMDFDEQTEEGLFEPVIPKLKLRSTGKTVDTVSTTPTMPGIYWKTFGDKIKESFNKSKTATTTDATPVPPTFWMNFGKAFGKALSDTKTQIVGATQPTTMSPVATGAEASVTPVQPLDDAFWDNFGKQLDSAINPTASLSKDTTTETSPDFFQPSIGDNSQQILEDDALQSNDNELMYQKPRLYLSSPVSSTSPLYVVPLTKTPVSPIYWKTYGDAIANTASQMKPPVFTATPMTAPVTTGSGMVIYTPTAPGFYWKSYGDQMAGHFINAKGQILDTVSKIKPTYYPFFMPPNNPMIQDPDVQQQYQDWQQTDDLQQTPNWAQNLNYGRDEDADDFAQQSYNTLKKRKLYMSGGSADDDTLTGPGLYWKNYGQNIKTHFEDVNAKTKQDVVQAKTEQPVYNFDDVDPTTLPEAQANFWSAFSQNIKDNYSKAKAKFAEFAG